MKVQDVKKECLATVGLSIEFSNSEVDSVVSLVRDLDISIQKGISDLESFTAHTKQINSVFEQKDQGAHGRANINLDNATVTVDLKSLFRAFKLLDAISNHRAFNSSGLFDGADIECGVLIDKINRGEI